MEINGWSDEDKALASGVLGKKALYHMISSSATPQSSLSAVSTDESLHNKLSTLVETSDPTKISWNYAIFWQLMTNKSGESVLAWGDGCCCQQSPEEKERELTRILKVRVEQDYQQRMRKQVLQNLHAAFDGNDENDGYTSQLDKVTNMEMLFLASMYFTFPKGQGSVLESCFGTGNMPLWINDAACLPSTYCARWDLARSAGIQTVVLIPTNIGVVELGSVTSVPEDSEFIKAIESSFSSHAPNVTMRQDAPVMDKSDVIPIPNSAAENPKAVTITENAQSEAANAPAVSHVDSRVSSSIKKLRLGKDGVDYVSAWTPYSLFKASNPTTELNCPESGQPKSIPEAANVGPEEVSDEDQISQQAETAQLALVDGQISLADQTAQLELVEDQQTGVVQLQLGEGQISQAGAAQLALIEDQISEQAETARPQLVEDQLSHAETAHLALVDTTGSTSRPQNNLESDEPQTPAAELSRDTSGAKKRAREPSSSNARDHQAAPPNHVEAERQRRARLNEHFGALREVLPNVAKTDRISLLENAASHIAELQERLKTLEAGKENKVEVENGERGLTVRLTTPMASHPAAGLVGAIEEANGLITMSKMVYGSEKAYHTFVVEPLFISEGFTKEKLDEALSRDPRASEAS